jgi:hypothetical protein
MSRPKVISYALASLDGRLTVAPDALLLYGDERWTAVAGSSEDAYAWLMAEFRPQAILEGSGSFSPPALPSEPLPAVEGDPAGLYRDYLPDPVVNVPGRRWFTVVDGGGRVRWFYKEFPGDAWVGWRLLVLVSQATPPEYLAYLRREQIPYLVAGSERVDLSAAFEKLADTLHVETLVSTAGGHLSGALLRHGLIDEAVVAFFPALIGGEHTPALFNAPDLRPGERPVKLELLECQTLPAGHIRLHYRVCAEAE